MKVKWIAMYERYLDQGSCCGLFEAWVVGQFRGIHLRLRIGIADSGLMAIEDRRLSEDRGERCSTQILSPPLIADPRLLLVLRPQSQSEAVITMTT